MTDDEDDDNDDELAIAGVAYGFLKVAGAVQAYAKKRHRAAWSKPLITQWPAPGAYSTLFSELMGTDEPVIGCQDKICRELTRTFMAHFTIVLFCEVQGVNAEK